MLIELVEFLAMEYRVIKRLLNLLASPHVNNKREIVKNYKIEKLRNVIGKLLHKQQQ